MKRNSVLSVLAALLLAPGALRAQNMGSALGDLFPNVVDNGGAVQSSGPMSLIDTVGELSFAIDNAGGGSLAAGYINLLGGVGAPPPPAFGGRAKSASSIQWSWTQSSYALGYRVVSSSGGFLSPPLGAGTTFWLETGLSTNTSYARNAQSFNTDGESLSPSVSRYTWAVVPASAAVVSVSSSTVGLSWSANGNPAWTAYRVNYWAVGGSTSAVRAPVSSATISALDAATTYFMSVRAVNGDSIATAASPAVSTFTLGVPSVAVWVGPPGGTVVINGPYGLIELDIPPGCFTQPELVTLAIPPGYPADSSVASIITAATGVGVDVTVAPYVLPLKEPRLLMSYRPARVVGLDPARFIIARYDDGRRTWVPYGTDVELSRDLAVAMLNHFSLFQIVQSAPSATLSTFKAFPDPLRPASGQLFMTFSMLPAGAGIKIYTVAGSLVRSMSADDGGVARWDGTNQAGAEAASGVYFVLVQDPGSKKTQSFRVAVQR